jgi:LmbE family N-acetylglucosaminyl deacetylase
MYNTHEFIHGFVGALKFASMNKMIPLIWALLLSFMATGQKVPTGLEEILHALRSLQKETRVLYLAAHPDDENTRLISWLTHGAGVETAYLSLTRGSGGQNLIGAELGAPLGYIRTQELLEARKIDGGRQFFTRAVDFGYSKNPEETFAFWGKEEVLSDVVRVIRAFRPHIIITRFPTDGRGGHGHHTASALLAAEAFDLAGSLSAFPHEYGIPWSPEMLYWNASSWWDKTLPDRAAKEDGIIEVEVGGFDPINGRSCNELASMSRSMHKSQGFGVSMARGEMKEYLIHQKGANAFYERLFGEVPGKANNGARQAAELLAAGDRSGAIKKLLDLKEEGNNSPAFDRRVDGIVAGLLGLHAEALVQNGSAAVGQQLDVELRCIKRMDIPLTINKIDWNGRIQDQSEELQRDQMLIINDRIRCGTLNGPYWLDRPFSTLHDVPDSLIGLSHGQGRPLCRSDLRSSGQAILPAIGCGIQRGGSCGWRIEKATGRCSAADRPFCLTQFGHHGFCRRCSRTDPFLEGFGFRRIGFRCAERMDRHAFLHSL